MPKTCPRCLREPPKGASFCPFDGALLEERFDGFVAKRTQHTGAILDGRFQIHGFVSKGATARVYLAEDLATQEIVVVKMFAPAVAEREAMRSRFLEEARALAAIDHPNVVKVRAAGQMHDGAPWLVMEALRGETLDARLERSPVPLDVALRLFREIAAGLEAAHQASIVHRDVKPDNVFLVDTEAGPSVKLIDFGMAKVRRARPRDAGPQRTSSEGALVLGTMQYMAPEQIVSEPVDPRTDVYGLGVLMFRVVTGHLPFDAELGPDLLSHHLFSPAPPPSWLHDDLDPRVDRVILSAMRKARENRYPTMRALLEDLERPAPEGWPMTTHPDVYEPQTSTGREAIGFLSSRFRIPVP